MKVILAEAYGMCFGVQQALKQTHAITHPGEVTLFGELVHNAEVNAQLRAKGFQQMGESGRTQIPATSSVLITAHGISHHERQRLQDAGKQLIDTTCPLVKKIQQAAQDLSAMGFYILFLGKPGHAEVCGIMDDIPDGEVISGLTDVRCYESPRLGILCQSTLQPDTTQAILEEIRRLNPDKLIHFVDTICQPTKQRQQAVKKLLPQIDVLLVVGGQNSNNTRQLVQLAQSQDKPVFHIQNVEDIQADWFTPSQVIGLTAGTSTPEYVVMQVWQYMEQLNQNLTLNEVHHEYYHKTA